MLHLIETPETSTLRLNADAISYLGNAFNKVEFVIDPDGLAQAQDPSRIPGRQEKNIIRLDN